MISREKSVSEDEFKRMLAAKLIRAASLEDVSGTHHSRSLYKHPRTGQWFVAVNVT
jgi:hypothetical protein